MRCSVDDILGAPFKKIMEEYIPDDYRDIESNVIEELLKLPEHEQNMFLLYAETNSLRELSKIYQCGHSILYYKIKSIKEKLKHVKKYD